MFEKIKQFFLLFQNTGSPTKNRKDTSVVTPSKKKRKLSPAKSGQ